MHSCRVGSTSLCQAAILNIQATKELAANRKAILLSGSLLRARSHLLTRPAENAEKSLLLMVLTSAGSASPRETVIEVSAVVALALLVWSLSQVDNQVIKCALLKHSNLYGSEYAVAKGWYSSRLCLKYPIILLPI